MSSIQLLKRTLALLISLNIIFSFTNSVSGQMRQVYVDNAQEDNEINKLSFYSPGEGYVAFSYWIGYTTDSGKTFTKKYITINNVNFNGYSVNLTFGFGIKGIKAFSQSNIIVYGDYGLVPAILSSTDGGTTFKLVYLFQYGFIPSGGISDMLFPQNGSTGYAVDVDQILKTTDRGLTWNVVRTEPNSCFDHLEGSDDNTVFAISDYYTGDIYSFNNLPVTNNKILKTINAGNNWQIVSVPVGDVKNVSFLTAQKGWLSVNQDVWYTVNAGGSWLQKNNTAVTPFYGSKIKFINDSTGYALSGFDVIKTTDSGKVWESLPRDNGYSYLGYGHNDLQVLNANQLWAGGGHGFLELSTNGGGTTFPKALFAVDTAGLSISGAVRLVNYSKPGYTYQWFLNKVLLSSAYNTSYLHNIYRTGDTITLVVTKGTKKDTAVQYQGFYPPVIVSSFSPTISGAGGTITITGLNFSEAATVSFGGIAATGFTIVSPTTIAAIVGQGASGKVIVATPNGQGSLAGFTFLEPPTITSFVPLSAVTGTTVTITGTNFTGATSVSFGGTEAIFFTVMSSTSIRAEVPSGTSGAVRVTTPGGSFSLDGFISLPTIVSFTPQSGTQGTLLHISGTSLTGTTGVSVGGIPVTSFTVDGPESITAIVGSGATGNVTVTKPGGTSLLNGFTWFAPPVITSFAPMSGPVRTSVTITGSGFNAVPADNIIYFGAVRATVTGGSGTTLTVTVPTGATFEKITVTSNHLTGYSMQPFLVTFPGGGSITPATFTTNVMDSLANDYPTNVAIADLDGDGKTDLVVTHYSDNSLNDGVLIYRNTSTVADVSFAAPFNIDSLDYKGTYIADLDGDGKPDLAVITASGIAVFRNTSSGGAISFVAGAVLPCGNAPQGIAFNDIDGDGKPDMAFGQYPDGVTSILRNTSEPGNIAFAPRINLPYMCLSSIILADLDGDRKPELIIPNPFDNNFSVLKNNCTKGNISFGMPLIFSGYPNSCTVTGDMDNDGKTDLVTCDINGSRIGVIRNTGSGSTIAFATPVTFDATSAPSAIAISDMDGDGKPDIGTVLMDHSFAVFKNASTPGNISFAPKVDYVSATYNGNHMIALGDMDGDGKNDAVTVSETRHTVTIHTNKALPQPFIVSFAPTIGDVGTSVTITGVNFTGVTAVSFGGIPASSFTINSPTSISAVVGAGATGDVTVVNSFGTGARPGFVFGRPPVITSISPEQGSVGSDVTISGNNFSNIVAENIVYFGGVRALVTAAATASLTVKVPIGAALLPVTVTVKNLTAYSAKLFNPTFPGAAPSFSAASFALPIDRAQGGNGTLSDLDGDGKLDLVMGGSNSDINVARNISTVDTISFTPNINFAIGAEPQGVTTGDLDGDGKLDVVTYNYESQSISVMRNSSTPGNILLSTPSNYLTGPSTTRPVDATIMDIDGDGKPDIIVANYYSSTISIFKNQSTPGAISLATRIDYAVEGYPTGVVLRDVNGDGKPDLVTSVNDHGASVFINTGLPGTISFANKLDFVAGSWPNAMTVSDLDGDGKFDMIIPNINSNTISVFRNNGSGNGLSFTPKQDFISGDGPTSSTVGDLDGDGKPDIIEQNIYSGQNVSILKNNSTSGNISMQPRADYLMTGTPFRSSVGDIDGDGVADLVVYVLGGTTSILRNLTGHNMIIRICGNTDTSISSNITGTSYQWKQNAGAGFVNITDNINFSGTATSRLQLTNTPSTWNNYQYKCIVNGILNSTVFILNITPSVAPTAQITIPSKSICAGTNADFTATTSNGGVAPLYQWKKNGLNVGVNDSVYSSSSLINGDIITMSLTSHAVCSVPAVVTSNSIIMNVSSITPSITISGDTKVTQGSSTIILSVITGGGLSPTYQWQDSTATHSWDEISGAGTASINYLPAADGDGLRCILTSNETCLTKDTVASSAIFFTLAPPINPVLGSPGIHYYPNPVNSILTIDSLDLNDQWETLVISGLNGLQNIISQNIAGQTKVTVHVDGLPAAMYVAILKRKQGRPVYLKFIKL